MESRKRKLTGKNIKRNFPVLRSKCRHWGAINLDKDI